MISVTFCKKVLFDVDNLRKIQVIKVHFSVIDTKETRIKSTPDVDNEAIGRVFQKISYVLVIPFCTHADVYNQSLIQLASCDFLIQLARRFGQYGL
ncbi:MAG: hypothetical protein AMJ75_11210 [Phycisphaerae bacterium SM1_79]|nr:MAG: hypothetical protein AMJ75_11210 [Phycisphaerae bacterium SM1_79]